MPISETGITFNGIPIEYLTNKDLIYLANKMKIEIDCDYNDRESILALIDNAFLRMRDREIIDPYSFYSLNLIVVHMMSLSLKKKRMKVVRCRRRVSMLKMVWWLLSNCLSSHFCR